MVAIASVPLRLDETMASMASPTKPVVVFSECGREIASRLAVVTFKLSNETGYRLKYVMPLRPRKFGDGGRNLLKITRQVEWPMEPDID